MNWRPYAPCCHRSALAPNCAFCGECGRPLLRCMAFQECFSLVTPREPCPMCIAPSLAMEKGALVRTKVGDRLSIPLVFRNNSQVQRPLRVEAIAAFIGGAEVPVPLAWEHVDAQSERSFTIETPTFDQAGLHAVRIVATLATRYKGREEIYAFAGFAKIAVEAPENSEIVQHFDLSGAQLGTGTLIHAAPTQRSAGSREASVLGQREPLSLERAERYEIEKGIRGYPGGMRVLRTVSFNFAGFSASDHPPNGTNLGQAGSLACGRAGRRYDPATNPLPSDLSLRVYGRDGELDEQAAVYISRHHFDLIVLNDRLCVQARGANGLKVNAKKLAAGEIEPLRDGERVFPMPGHPDRLALKFKFQSSLGNIESVEIARVPAMEGTQIKRA